MKNKNHQRVFMNPATKKRGIVSEYIPWLLIALAVLAIIVITIFLLKEKGISIIDSIKNLFKGR